jgi:hypothetical protein
MSDGNIFAVIDGNIFAVSGHTSVSEIIFAVMESSLQ